MKCASSLLLLLVTSVSMCVESGYTLESAACRAERVRSLVAARLFGEEITIGDIDAEIATLPHYDNALYGAVVYPKLLASLRPEVLKSIIAKQLLRHAALQSGLVDINRVHTEVERAFLDLKSNAEALAFYTKRYNIGEELVKERYFHDFIVRAFLAEKSRGIRVSQEELRLAYERERAQRYHERYFVRVSHIFLEVKKGASIEEEQAVYRRIRKAHALLIDGKIGFSELARRISESNTKRYGGYLGRVIPGKYPKEFEDAVFSLRPGEISEPIRTEKGFDLIQSHSSGENEFPSLEQMEGELIQMVEQEKQEKLLQTVIQEELKRSDLEIALPGLDLEEATASCE